VGEPRELRFRFHGPYTDAEGELVEQLVDLFLKWRPRRGRPRSYHQWEWAWEFERRYAEALAEHADNHVGDESPLGRIEICGGIALDDFAAHPERFPYDPAENLDGAARLVYEAIQEPLRANERAKNRLSKPSEK
jgi:hypothetical protein